VAFLVCTSAPARAVEVYDLYEAQAPVANKTAPEREKVLGQLLLAVATKVSGQRDPASNEVMAQAARRPDAYVQQFRYRARAAGANQQGAAGSGLALSAQFDPQAMEDLLSRAGLPVWGRIRPSVLVWLAVKLGDQRQLVGADDASDLVGVLEQAASERGVPIVLPLLDLEDRARLSVSDVWAGFDEAILNASQRYQTKTVLVGRVERTLPTLWEGRWRLVVEGSNTQWHTEGNAVKTTLAEGMQHAADLLAARFAARRSGSSATDLELVVNGVRTLQDYARTLRYLQSLDIVNGVRVIRADSDQVSFRLLARGGQDALEQVISFSRTLAPVQVAGRELEFRLLP
jgi:hypothetical protein